ncbi:hypothetical protein [Paraburkholderia nodosa]|uniref:hypothetical protein n=1 Tax=Paraburkholderia nodosa TaxID=392320 RepID=UPI0004B7A0F6|nr:hypothetical protein [Paraburkholderia nodosa]
MALLGGAIIVAWLDVPSEHERDLLDWHSREHLPERLAIDGFCRGRRFGNLASASRIFILYELRDRAVLYDEAYLERLNHPTPWTRQSMQHFHNSTRAAMRIDASIGRGIGAYLLTARFDTAHDDALRVWLCEDLVPVLALRPGITAVHLATKDAVASDIDTVERRHSGTASEPAAIVLLVEAYSADVLSKIGAVELGEARLQALGYRGPAHCEIMQLQYCLEAG